MIKNPERACVEFLLPPSAGGACSLFSVPTQLSSSPSVSFAQTKSTLTRVGQRARKIGDRDGIKPTRDYDENDDFVIESVPESSARSLEQWILLFKKSWTRGAGSTLDLARTLCTARTSLRHGQWAELWRRGATEIPFSKRKGDMLVRIGETFRTANEQTSAHLPLGWNILHCIARLGLPLVERLIAEGRIHPRLTLNQAQDLLDQYGLRKAKRSQSSRVRQRVVRFVKFVQDNWPDLSEEDRRFTRGQLLILVGPSALLPNRTLEIQIAPTLARGVFDAPPISENKQLETMNP
jgi:hypothetical protein